MSYATHYDALRDIIATAVTAITAADVHDARGLSAEAFLDVKAIRYPAVFLRGSHFAAKPESLREDGIPAEYEREMMAFIASMPNGADGWTMIDELIAYLRDTANAYDLDDGTSWTCYIREGIDQEEQFGFPIWQLTIPLSQTN